MAISDERVTVAPLAAAVRHFGEAAVNWTARADKVDLRNPLAVRMLNDQVSAALSHNYYTLTSVKEKVLEIDAENASRTHLLGTLNRRPLCLNPSSRTDRVSGQNLEDCTNSSQSFLTGLDSYTLRND